MNFFDEQSRALRRSSLLLALFFLAVLFLICGSNAILALILTLTGADAFDFYKYRSLYAWTSLGTLSVIGLLSLAKIISLSMRGGISIALDLGAESVEDSSNDLSKQQLIHVVEEMSIASGIPKPEIFLLKEPSINAFAAGNSIKDAVIAVSSGALEKLKRDELQGVVAHEFSHILYGDMKLNMRLLGILHGIMGIATLGRFLMRVSHRPRRSESPMAYLLIAGLLIWILGSIGSFFGRWIQSAISRQREYLADAAAVQFTRNPDGLAGALMQIKKNSNWDSAWADEMNHFFIAPVGSSALGSLFSSHPPIDQRVRRILQLSAQAPLPSPTKRLSDQAGRLRPQALSQAQHLLSQLHPHTLAATRQSYSARAILYALFLSRSDSIRQNQADHLGSRLQHSLAQSSLRIFEEICPKMDSVRLPLLELCLPALKKMSDPQKAHLLKMTHELTQIDQKIDLSEFSLLSILEESLEAREKLHPRASHQDCILALNHLFCLGLEAQKHPESEWSERLRGLATKLRIKEKHLLLTERPQDPFKMLQILRSTPLAFRKLALDGLEDLLIVDGQIVGAEAELIRAVSLSLSIPLPFSVGSLMPKLESIS
jgi:Zn-dependent protease with chaperone function